MCKSILRPKSLPVQMDLCVCNVHAYTQLGNSVYFYSVCICADILQDVFVLFSYLFLEYNHTLAGAWESRKTDLL